MRSNARWPIAVGLVVSIVLVSRARTDHDVVVAQTRKPVVITRLYTGPDGLTHADEVEVKLTGTGTTEVSEMLKVIALDKFGGGPKSRF